MHDLTDQFLASGKFDSSCHVKLSSDALDALKSKRLRVTVNKMGRSKVKVTDLEILIRAKSGVLNFNISGSKNSVDIGKNVHGKFDFRLYRNSHVKVGEQTTSGSTVIFCKDSKLYIEKDCMFSTGVVIQTSNQHGIVDITQGNIINKGDLEVHLGEHVWLGRNVMLAPGAVVGSGSLIAIGSVVTGKIPSHVIAGGYPAKVLRNDRTWCRSSDELDAYSTRVIRGDARYS
jgi:acetyltransferase-like isoleucine patch superfamily enzyme